MNRRTLKKLCHRAKAELIATGQFNASDFDSADGEETIDAPRGMETRFIRNGFLEPGPLKGTPLMWFRTSYEYDEGDYKLPTAILADIKLWENFDYDEYRELESPQSP